MLPVLIVILLGFSVFFPGFLSTTSLQGLLRDSAVLIIAATGATLVFLISGLDLSVGSAVAAAAVSVAIFTDNGGSLAAGVLLGLLTALLVGVLNGVLVGALGLNPFIITLASLLVVRALGYVATAINSGGGGTAGAVPMPEGVATLGRSLFLGIPTIFYGALLVVLVSFVLLEFTSFGRQVRLVGQNEVAARFAGLRVSLVRFGVYSIAGLLSGIAGVVLSYRLGSASPAVGDALLLQVITAVIIGGTAISGGSGGIWRTLWGALTIVTVERGMSLLGFKFYDNQIVLGLVILIGALSFRSRSDSKKVH